MERWTSLEWTGRTLRFIDQTRLPDEVYIIEAADHRVVADAIRALRIRGAPAIGVAAAYAVVLAVPEADDASGAVRSYESAIDLLSRTRPTAVNLFSALKRMQKALQGAGPDADLPAIRGRLLHEAQTLESEERESSRLIAQYGVPLLSAGSSVLTHCNTGELAAPGGGTALNIIVEAARRGKVNKVFVDETRPLLQGARLTSWELKRNGIEPTLITDSTAGFLMQKGEIGSVIVGADRIAMNGDFANKIGTYSLAVLAGYHGIPFYVAAPVSTVDLETQSGSEIQIEERSAEEVTRVGGKRIAPAGVDVYAPAFDVTPHSLITAIVTNLGVVTPPFRPGLEALWEQTARANVSS